jgi:hypothetical protein
MGVTIEASSVARFRQVDLSNPHTHHDALELVDGRIIKLTLLHEGQRARVLQLPVNAEYLHGHTHAPAEEAPAVEIRARESVFETVR